MREGHPILARQAARELVERLAAAHGPAAPTTVAAQEVLAYVTFVAGYHVRAGRLYAELALAHPTAPEAARLRRELLADNAHFCWLKAGASPSARELGALVVTVREATGPASALEAAVGRLAAL
ncbi:hypothetical protein [Streptodolium elevatio]|uniref:Uncharacterized protein n=1 Tax=Streptodolium elevatio TaxID=3157996 RepID=A0ABV3D9Q7_9ACTN